MSIRERLNLSQILATAFVTLVVTVGSGLILSNIQTREPQLIYSTTETTAFSGQKQLMGVYHISMGNEGKKVTKDVICFISILPARIEQWDVSVDPAIQYTEIVTNNTLMITFHLLNPKETAEIFILATHQSTLPKIPEVSLRAEGIIGKEKRETQTTIISDYWFGILIALLGILAGLTTLFLKNKPSSHIDPGEQNRVWAYLFGNYGLIDEMENYLSKDSTVSYWAESDRLGILAKDFDDVKRNIIKSILKNILIYDPLIEKPSKGILCYNIARIEAIQGNEEEMRKNLDEAKKYMGALLNTRLKVDPIFKDVKYE